jgi:non-haem Fe2+, alpha-ketoglutarate-dependent halogenase
MISISSPSTRAAEFARNGYISGIPVLSEAEAFDLRDRSLRLLDTLGPSNDVLRQIHLYEDWASRLIRRPAILDIVASILGSELLVRAVMLLRKRPHSPFEVLWHSDQAFTQKGLTPQLSAWIALNPSFPENGCLQVVPGSQAVQHPHHMVEDPRQQLRKGLTVVTQPTPTDIVPLRLAPGEMSLHHPGILHASGPNTTDITRLGFIIRYITPTYPPDTLEMTRVLGDAPCPHLIFHARPIPLDGQADIPALLEYNRKIEASLGHA